jgi:hypothetical protein
MPRDVAVLALVCFVVSLVAAVGIGRRWGPRWGFVVLGVGVVLALFFPWSVFG